MNDAFLLTLTTSQACFLSIPLSNNFFAEMSLLIINDPALRVRCRDCRSPSPRSWSRAFESALRSRRSVGEVQERRMSVLAMFFSAFSGVIGMATREVRRMIR